MAAMEGSRTPAKSSMAASSTSKVRVIVRVRPFTSIENRDQKPCISVLDQEMDSAGEVAVYLQDNETSRNECYRLDSFFGQDDNNVGQIFEREVRALIPGIFQGFNATVFAYGATGSGKTYTMQGTNEQPGLMPLAMNTILSMCLTTGSKAEISYYEVYLDKCYDLLELKPKEISVWDDKDGQIHMNGLSQAPVNSMLEFDDVFSCGVLRRKVAHTGLNDVSSRSHGVLVISVSRPCNDGSGDVLLGKLNLIDLAGNEDNRRTCNEGIRLQESAKINQSLFALSNVIFALNNNKARIPYRDSKLTRILQDSLGGKSRALMIACLNPGEYQQSVHTVSLAARSRNISNFVPSAHKQETPKVNVDMEVKLRAWLESKGKTKSINRIQALNSPLLGSSVKKTNNQYSSVKAKVITNRVANKAKEGSVKMPYRNLFGYEDLQEYWSKTLKEGSTRDNLEPLPAADETLDQNLATEDVREETKQTTDQLSMESNMHSLDEQPNHDERSKDSVRSAPTSENRSPLRKILAPINTNTNTKPVDEFSFEDQLCSALLEPKTPKTPSIFACADLGLQNMGTPIDKFNSRSFYLKNYLVQEYIDFLNTARREELLELKGIGVKIAEYILELRETSPLKSLSDLEKIGLSTKQVQNLFSRTARGIFGKEVSTPNYAEVLQVN